jgi:GDPmannose 4,6-dehydratase
LGDPTKAKSILGWEPLTTAREMCAEMVASDLRAARRDVLLKSHGHVLPVGNE